MTDEQLAMQRGVAPPATTAPDSPAPGNAHTRTDGVRGRRFALVSRAGTWSACV